MRESAALKQADATKSSAEDIVNVFTEAVNSGDRSEAPYPHWVLKKCFPDDTIEDILGLPFPAPSLEGVSGKRELHNATRKYFDVENREKFASVDAVSEAFQDKRITDMIEQTFGTDLSGTYLRIEFAQDTDGFWLEPHTDLGVKSFTMLLYLSDEDGHDNLGTDVYDASKSHVARSPFEPNLAFVFVPGDNTYHGFEKRPIPGVRKSLIINYVTDEWRAREQLAFPEAPIA
ncbi:MAG: 2OG-Fe(II) oxygenase [Methyloceanibacter sp.]|nr:2OG-Fe(II) oxygenase [Methyloceanibacter sp.]